MMRMKNLKRLLVVVAFWDSCLGMLIILVILILITLMRCFILFNGASIYFDFHFIVVLCSLFEIYSANSLYCTSEAINLRF